MPDKIELPPERPCPVCGGTGNMKVEVGRVKPGPGISSSLVGEPTFGFEPCTHCSHAGCVRVFDEVAAAVERAGYYYRAENPDPPHQYVEISTRHQVVSFGTGPTPTAALVAAVEKHNEGAAVIAVAEVE